MAEPRAEGVEEPAPLIWRSLPLRLAMAAIPFLLIASALVSRVAWPLKLLIATTFGLSLATPAGGLLLVAALAPLSNVVAPMISAIGFRVDEALVLAFLLGWLLQDVPDRRGPRVAAPAATWLFATVIAASIVGLAWQLARFPGVLPRAIEQIVQAYFLLPDPIGLIDGARLLEGLGLAVATVTLFRRRPTLAVTLPLAMATSAAAAALSSVLLWRGIGSEEALARVKMIGYRVSAHVADVNAAGSYFAMIACLTLGLAMRDRGRRRVMWFGLAAASGVGLWFSESRSALGAAGAVITVAGTWAATSRLKASARAATLAAIVIALIGGLAVRARLLDTDPTYRGGGFREQFVQTSARMIAARPLFGVGEGQYYPSSPLFLPPQLAWTYGVENAHNFFLQVGGELGLVGLTLFGICLGAPLVRAARALASAPRDWRLLGISSGVVVFLITCLTGHPFLVSQVAYPFWMQLGLMAALAGSAVLNRTGLTAAGRADRGTPRASRIIAAAAAIVIAIGSPSVTARAELTPPASHAVDGMYPWETLEDGTRFRWTGQYASLFVPADVTRVEIPVRLPTDGRSLRPMGVEVMTGAVDRGRTMVDAKWAILSIPLAPVAPPARFKRIDLKIDRVWQPALYVAGSADMRLVGMQVGEPRLIRE
jgi:O-antigen ligase